ncbi:3-oxoacyl-ACP reductase [Pseudonocardia eucalypti]|uniref:3-oxoacyl-ACP reductase n=1 Tax=Pseudonocardia eucalypti TaxID=648755 RepID=A0ABP9QQ99_9PSEU|nr:3-oxoacyl-[acyl-carrier protein] reductase [Pseudonocardia eucalypti]
MTDTYARLVNGGPGAALSRRLGLPRPVPLRRYTPGQPLVDGPVLVGAVGKPRFAGQVRELVPEADSGEGTLGGVVLDAAGLARVGELAGVREFLRPALRRLGRCGRLVVLGSPPERADSVESAAARQALDGLVRSVAKELRDGATANLVLAEDGADLGSTVRFLLSARSAYVDGQVIRVASAERTPAPEDPPHAGRVVLVTGAARGIGAAIAEVFARDGATVVCLDVPAQGEALGTTANRLGALAVQLDITAPDAPARLVRHLRERQGGVDVVVHNAGVTRDKLLVNMDEARWDTVLAVNLRAQLDLNEALLAGPLRDGGRIVSVASTSGIAGNRGQANYAASKAGVIGMVRALAPVTASRSITVNAVAPGFIETEMTGAMPLATREAGRRINSLRQGGLPVDVAETVAWLAEPSSAGVTGQVVRVCGQSMLGA